MTYAFLKLNFNHHFLSVFAFWLVYSVEAIYIKFKETENIATQLVFVTSAK